MQATSGGSTTSSTEKVQPPGITIGGPDAVALRQLTEDLSIFNSTDALAELVEKLKGLSVGELELYLRKVASRNPFYSLFDGYSGWDLDPSSTRPEFLKELKWWAFCGPKYDQYTLAPKGAWGGSQNYPYATCGVSAVVYGTFLGHIECLQVFDGLILYPSTAECPCDT